MSKMKVSCELQLLEGFFDDNITGLAPVDRLLLRLFYIQNANITIMEKALKGFGKGIEAFLKDRDNKTDADQIPKDFLDLFLALNAHKVATEEIVQKVGEVMGNVLSRSVHTSYIDVEMDAELPKT